MKSIFYTLISSIPMFVCAFWTVVFFLHIRHKHISRKILLGFMFTATCLYFGHFVVFNHLKNLIPVTDTIYTFSTLSVYPIFYIYILSLTGKVRPRHWLVLLPALLIAGTIGVCYGMMSAEETGAFVKACLYEKSCSVSGTAAKVSVAAHIVMKYVILCQVLSVLPLGYKRLSVFKRKVGEYFANIAHRDLREIRVLLLLLVITSCLSVVADLIGRAYFVDSAVRMLVVLLPFAVMLFSIGYVGYVQNFTIDDLQLEIQPAAGEPVEETAEMPDESVLEGRMKIMEEIDRLMKDEKLFLLPDLKISDISARLGTNRTYVYEALKYAGGENKSFTDYVNEYRIKYAIELQNTGTKGSYNENIMFECGFASKTTFYKNFKKFTGKTPKQYFKETKQNPE